MFEAMRVAALLHKLTSNNPETLPAGQVLELATRRGARASAWRIASAASSRASRPT